MACTKGPATITLWGNLWLHLCLGGVLGTNAGLDTAAWDTFVARQQQQEQQQVASLVTPQLLWLSSLLSLPHPHHAHAAAAAARKVADSPAGEGELATLSLVVPLDQLADNDDSGLSPAAVGRAAKRGGGGAGVCRGAGSGRRACRRASMVTVPASEVRQKWNADYLSIPETLVAFSQHQAEEEVCKNLEVQVFGVDLRQHNLNPVWLRETLHLGACPSMLQQRRLGEDVWPPSVVEVKCMCQGESCSSQGVAFKCVAVQQAVRTWVRLNSHTFVPSQEIVSVGCVCVQRTSEEAKQLNLMEG